MTDALTNAQKILEVADRIRGLSQKMPDLARAKAEAEHEYQLASSKAYFLLRHKGMSQGDAKEYVKGVGEELSRMLNVFDLPLVGEYRFKRDLAEGLEDANKRALRASEVELSGLQSVQRDYKEL